MLEFYLLLILLISEFNCEINASSWFYYKEIFYDVRSHQHNTQRENGNISKLAPLSVTHHFHKEKACLKLSINNPRQFYK
jgi:hypothetical protein